MFLIPHPTVTGLLYYMYNSWPEMGITALSPGILAFLHTAGGVALLVFPVVHASMTTTGHSLTAHFKAVCTGHEEVPVAQKNT